MKKISHLTFICKDIVKSAQLFCDLFGAKEIYSSDGRNFSISNEKFLLIGELWIALMQGNPIEKSYNHVAFHIKEDELEVHRSKIQKYGLEILPGRSRDAKEGQSIYFYDYDNHLFELHTGTLEGRLQFYREQSQ